MVRRSLLGLALASGCAGSGRVSLDFSVPTDPSLVPAGASTLTLIARMGDETPRATTAEIADDGTVDLGDLPVGDEVWLSAEMRSAQGELVGYGRAPGAIAISATADTQATIPMRRPFAFLAGGGSKLVSVDASVSPTQTYQGSVSLGASPSVIADVGGTDIATITSGGAIAYYATRDNGASDLPNVSVGGAPKDAIATPDGAYLVVGLQGQVAIVRTQDGTIATASVAGSADRVAVTRGSDGAWWGVALLSRATADTGCPQSQLAAFPLASPDQVSTIDAGAGLSDIGGDPRTGTVLLADRCGGHVVSFDPVTGAIGANILDIPKPTAVAAEDGHVWAVGHALETSSDPNTVPDGVVDAWLILGQADLVGGDSSVDALPPLIERTVAQDVNYPDQDIAQDLHANTVVADDLVVMPGGEHLALTLHAEMAGDALVDGTGAVVIPSLDMTTQEYWLLDASTRAPTQRVRTDCSLVVGPCDPFACILQNWNCLPDVDNVTGSPFTPTGVIALYGAR